MKKCKRRHNSKKGITLVELVVAIAIVSIVFASTMTAIVHGYVSIIENKSLEDASAQAQGIADTVSTALEKAFSSNKYTGDETDKTAKKTFYNNLVLETINGDGSTYDGLSTKLNNVKFIDQISNPGAAFPDPSFTGDIQCTIQNLSNPLETSSTGGTKESLGYKVMVNAKSSQGDIIASSIVTTR